MAKNGVVYTIIIASLVIILYNHFLFTMPAEPSPIVTELNDLQKQAFSTLTDMTKLVISLSTALFGLIGYFALESFKAGRRMNDNYKLELVAAFSSAAVSIDFGYIYMDKWAEQLSIGIFRPNGRLVILPQQLQVVFFLLSLFFAGKLIYRNLFTNKP
jgi:hypothetical protein